MGKEAKIGLAVILVLLIVFGVVLYQRMGGMTADPGTPGADAQASESSTPQSGALALPESAPTIVAARSGADKLPKGTKLSDLDDWKVASDTHDATKNSSNSGSLPPSFMPKPAAASPELPALTGVAAPDAPADAPRYADVAQQAPSAGPFTSSILTNSVRNTDPQAAGNPAANQGQANPLRADAGAPPMPGGTYGHNGGQYQTPGYNNSSYSAYRTPADPYGASGAYQGAGGGYRGSLSRPIDVGQSLAEDGSYVVQPSDSYWTISERVYGSGAYFKALAEHNRKRNPEADQLRPGEKIMAPSVAELEKNYRDLCPKPEHREIAEQRTSMVNTVSHMSVGRVYVVQEGDTLFDIAKYELGKAGRWSEIFQLNRNVLGEQYDYLTPGMQLVLPTDQPAERPSEVLTQRPGSMLR